MSFLLNFLYPYIRYVVQFKYIRNLKELLRIKFEPQSFSSKTYVINSLDLASDFQSAVEYFIALCLVKNGNKVIILYDDVMKHIDRETVDMKYSFEAKNRARKWINRSLTSKVSNIQFIPYSELIGSIEKIEEISKNIYDTDIYSFEEIEIKEYVDSSLIRYIHNGLMLCDANIKEVFVRASIFNAIISITVAREVFNRYQPNNVMSVHTVYSAWGPFMRYFKNKGFDPIQWSKGQAFEDSIFVTKWRNRQNADMYYSWLDRKNRLINEQEKDLLNSFLQSRFNRSAGFTKHIKGTASENAEQIINSFEKERTYAIFPNILWDNALTDADTVFSDVVEWLRLTLQYLIRLEANIIVRAHPAEKSFMKPTIGIIDIIKAEIPEIIDYNKIVFIKPESSLSSYWLFDKIKAGIIYNGTLGLEMAFKEIPVIFGGAPPYSDYCSLEFPKTKQTYFSYLSDPDMVQSMNSMNRDSLLTFMYVYFFEFESRVPFLYDKEWASFDFLSAQNLLIDGHESLDRICAFIETE
jgi:hypothetical protein